MNKKNNIQKSKNKKITTLIWISIFLLIVSPSLYADDPVFSNKNDDSGINHLFDKGDGRYLYVTPTERIYNTPKQEPETKERQKIIVTTRKRKGKEKEKSKLIRSKRTFSRMALKVKTNETETKTQKRTFAAFGEKFKKH